jgi:radical SAM protein with 4Fe4S-binding SPASM domain
MARPRACWLREHVPEVILAATAANSDRVDWVDDVTVARAMRAYAERAASDESVQTVLLDNFPGSGPQVRLLLGILSRLAPECGVTAAELVADERVRQARVRNRRVCHTCEHDPVHDPRLPAQRASDDPWRCARCGGTLHPRRGDAPRNAAEGYQGCIGRTLDRISISPDGRAYVCSYLFDTDLHFARMTDDGQVVLNHGPNEFDLFTGALTRSACGGSKSAACLGGCPAERIVTEASSCEAYPDIVPVCRLWKSSAKAEG